MKLTVPNPCPAAWNRMTGDNTRRFCHHCKKHVHNLSEMTAEQAQAVFEQQSNPCVRIDPHPEQEVRFQAQPIRTWFFVAAVSLAACLPQEPVPFEVQCVSDETPLWLPLTLESDVSQDTIVQIPAPSTSPKTLKKRTIEHTFRKLDDRFSGVEGERIDIRGRGPNKLVGIVVHKDMFQKPREANPETEQPPVQNTEEHAAKRKKRTRKKSQSK